MQETGILNRELTKALSEQGHNDYLMVVDAGFATPKGVPTIDLSIDVNKPTVLELLDLLKEHFSVEKLIIAKETHEVSPTMFEKISNVFEEVEVELIDHSALKILSKEAKTIIRTGDFTAYSNVLLVSGAGKRWYLEKS